MSPLIENLDVLELEDMPGFRIRRLQQIAVAIFLEEAQGFDITPAQFSAMKAIQREPGLDQRTLAGRIGFDTSTLGSVIDGLEACWLVVRNTSPTDRRVRLLTLSPHGVDLLQQIDPHMRQAQLRMLAPLSAKQRSDFMDALQILIDANNVFSRSCKTPDARMNAYVSG